MKQSQNEPQKPQKSASTSLIQPQNHNPAGLAPPPYSSSSRSQTRLSAIYPSPSQLQSGARGSHSANSLSFHSPLAFGPYLVPDTRPDSSENDEDEEDGQGPIYTSRSSGHPSGNSGRLEAGASSTTAMSARASTPTPSSVDLDPLSSTNATVTASSTTTTTPHPQTVAIGSERGDPPSSGLRHRFFSGLNNKLNSFKLSARPSSPYLASSSSSAKLKTISTTPGQLGAGETETEGDEPPSRLPTARIVRSSRPLIPPNTLTPLLFEFSRLLAIVPAVIGTIYNLYHVYCPPTSPFPGSNRKPPERIDFFVSALWAILTGYQCLALTTGLLTRWRLYYEPLSTLIRLLALQGICWPATQITLSLFEHQKRPLIVWALIGTTTCYSRSVQIWATSNLWWERRDDVRSPSNESAAARGGGGSDVNGKTTTVSSGLRNEVSGSSVQSKARRQGYWRRWGGKWGGRRWDWKEVSIKCVLPAGIMYFVMAWVELLRREWEISGK